MGAWGFIIHFYVFLNTFEIFCNKIKTKNRYGSPKPKEASPISNSKISLAPKIIQSYFGNTSPHKKKLTKKTSFFPALYNTMCITYSTLTMLGCAKSLLVHELKCFNTFWPCSSMISTEIYPWDHKQPCIIVGYVFVLTP